MHPEMQVRRLVHGMGYRFRLHKANLPGKPDLVFTTLRKVIFVHGCFWHQHAVSHCKITRRPKSNTHYWEAKLERNISRDLVNRKQLKKTGWNVLIVWECEIGNTQRLKNKISGFLG